MASKIFKIMMNRKVWPFLLLVVLFSGFFWAFKTRGEDIAPSDDDKYAKQQRLLSAIGNILESRHYSPKAIDDSFSQAVFNKYLQDLDPDKDLFFTIRY